MTRHMECIGYLMKAGISYEHALTLRRCAMTLHRWFELECGDGNDHGSWAIERNIPAHWHLHNPWKDSVVYVPIGELAACVAGGMITGTDGQSRPYTRARVLRNWLQNGNKVDAYILPQPDGHHSLGVRYG